MRRFLVTFRDEAVCTTGVYGEGLANALITDNTFQGSTTPHNAVFETGIKIKDNINLADN